jgi:hypothetical protein
VAVSAVVSGAKRQPVLLRERSVAGTGAISQSLQIVDPNSAPTIADETFLLQFTSYEREGCALHAEHSRDVLLGHPKFASRCLLLHTQQPGAQPLENAMTCIASCKLPRLRQKVLLLRYEQVTKLV